MALDMMNHFSDNWFMNWKNIIQDLINVGMTQAQIADECDTGQSHISSLFNGIRKSPNWKLGNDLIELHKRVLKNKKSEEVA